MSSKLIPRDNTGRFDQIIKCEDNTGMCPPMQVLKPLKYRNNTNNNTIRMLLLLHQAC